MNQPDPDTAAKVLEHANMKNQITIDYLVSNDPELMKCLSDMAETLWVKGKSDCRHDHSCHCGTAASAPHNTAQDGCVRFLTPPPVYVDGNFWIVNGHRITDFTLRQQRGYSQHPCGCWSRHEGSVNSIDA